MKNKIFLLIPVLFLAFFLTTSLTIHAQTSGGGGQNIPSGGGGSNVPPKEPVKYLQNPIKVTNVKDALILTIDIAIFIGTILAVLMFIWIGFKFVLAQGNDSKLKEAKDWFLYAAIGTAVLISSKVIVEVIKDTFVSTGIVNESLFKQSK